MTQPLKMVVKTPLSFTEPVSEQEDGCSLDQENGHLQWSCLNKSCFKSYHMMTQPLKIVVKTPMSSKDPVGEQDDRCSLDQENGHLQWSYAAGVLFLHTVIDYLWRMRKINVRVEMAEDTTAPRNVISNLNQRDKAFLEDENNCILLQKYLDSNPPYSQTLKDE